MPAATCPLFMTYISIDAEYPGHTTSYRQPACTMETHGTDLEQAASKATQYSEEDLLHLMFLSRLTPHSRPEPCCCCGKHCKEGTPL